MNERNGNRDSPEVFFFLQHNFPAHPDRRSLRRVTHEMLSEPSAHADAAAGEGACQILKGLIFTAESVIALLNPNPELFSWALLECNIWLNKTSQGQCHRGQVLYEWHLVQDRLPSHHNSLMKSQTGGRKYKSESSRYIKLNITIENVLGQVVAAFLKHSLLVVGCQSPTLSIDVTKKKVSTTTARCVATPQAPLPFSHPTSHSTPVFQHHGSPRQAQITQRSAVGRRL